MHSVRPETVWETQESVVMEVGDGVTLACPPGDLLHLILTPSQHLPPGRGGRCRARGEGLYEDVQCTTPNHAVSITTALYFRGL